MAALVVCSDYGWGPLAKGADFSKLFARHQKTILLCKEGNEQLIGYYKDVDLRLYCYGEKRSIIKKIISSEDIDIFVSFMDTRSIEAAISMKPNLLSVFADSLATWRIESFEPFPKSSLYFCQWLPGSTVGQQSLGGRKVHVLPPFATSAYREEYIDRLIPCVLNFGGILSPTTSEHLFQQFVLWVKDSAIDSFGVEGVESFGGLVTESGDLPLKFGGRETFLASLKKSDLVLTTPGLETVYEAASLRRKMLLLPPMNSTQLHQYLLFTELGLPGIIPHRLLPDLVEIKKLPWREQSNQLGSWIEMNSATLIETLRYSLQMNISGRLYDPHFHGDRNGVEVMVDQIVRAKFKNAKSQK